MSSEVMRCSLVEYIREPVRNVIKLSLAYQGG